ncbi:MAG: GIY-YIG nuclease family protein [Selenomonadaceae bacterium]|nr:GIY-YIG nuclease family protein [Selenomonadaceae bacterium]
MNNTKKNVESQTPPLFSVYVIWCRQTDMHYVGVTGQESVYKRIRQHSRGKKQFIDREIQRIGWEGNFDWWIVEEHVPSNLISECEQRWIKFFDCVHPKGYNKTIGGIKLFRHSEETKAQMRNRRHTEEEKANISKKMTGRKLTEEHKAKLGKLHSGKKLTEEHKAKLRAKAFARNMSGERHPMYGKHHTKESIEAMRQAHLGNSAHKGKHHTEETKATLREKALARDMRGENNPFFGKKHTEEAKDKNRQAHLGRTPWNKGKKMTEEQKAKMRAKKAAKAVAKENLAAANSTPKSLSTLNDAVIFQQGLSS